MIEYKQSRSKFWLKVFDNEDNTTISTNSMLMDLVECVSPELVDSSPTGWKKSKNYDDVYNLWIPNSRMDWDSLEALKAWAQQANRHIWLGTNRNTEGYFTGNEVAICIAADWNIDIQTKRRTEVGNAEYQLKYQYQKGLISKDDAIQYGNTLATAILDCVKCLPFNLDNYVVTTIPAVKEKQNKLAWKLARFVAEKLEVSFVSLTLHKDKPQMKEQSVEDKIKIWRTILADETGLIFSESVKCKDVLIIDDLYQSGASIWCLAEYLKEKCAAKTIVAITSVKALKNGDNR